mgnify:FL=1
MIHGKRMALLVRILRAVLMRMTYVVERVCKDAIY